MNFEKKGDGFMKEKLIKIINHQLGQMGIDNISVSIEIPKNKDNGDFSSNIAMQLTKILNKPPVEIANEIIKDISEPWITKIEIAGPGFINFYVKNDYLLDNINNVIDQDKNYGSCEIGNNEKVNIEFVSANPTGIMHIGNARGGAYGDSLARIMAFCGYDVTKEYYLNDAGNQINKLGRSVLSRYLTKIGVANDFPEDGYPGKEIYDIADLVYTDYQDKLSKEDLEVFKKYGVEYLTNKIMEDLKKYRIEYDVVTSEKEIYKKHPLDKVIDQMKQNGYIYEKDGAIWFKSSELYDDKDHVLVKADGFYTYLVPDIAYHMDKIDRGFRIAIDVLGTDHHGYVARLKSALKAVGYDDSILNVKLLQLVRIVRNGQVESMHKRSGNIVSLNDLISEVGVNAARYYFSKYSLDTQMDFDIELAKSKTNDNPVYYVCYAYARICSILNKYSKIEKCEKYNLITEEDAYNVLAAVYNFPDVVKSACQKQTPHVITNYVYELASLFHAYYEKCRVISEDAIKTNQNLNLLKSVQITLRNALNLIGVIPEERM